MIKTVNLFSSCLTFKFRLLCLFIVGFNISITIDLSNQKWFPDARKYSQIEGFFSQLDDFDRDIITGNTMSDRQENATVNESTVDQDFTVGQSNSDPAVKENLVIVKTLKRIFIEKVDKEVGYNVDTVEDLIQNANLTAIDSNITPKIELAISSINASSGRDATIALASLERGEHRRVSAPFEKVAEKINTLHKFNTNDETRNINPDEVSELSQELILTGNRTLITTRS